MSKKRKQLFIKNKWLFLSLGEIGRLRDLKSHEGLEKVVFNAFSESAIQTAAAFALGNIAIGNLEHYLPILLELIAKQEERLYLLLSSLNEIIKAASDTQNKKQNEVFRKSLDTVSSILYKYVEHKNEGVRQVAAESIGRLSGFDPQKFIPKLAALTERKEALQRLAGICALRFSFSETSEWPIVEAHLKTFMALLKDDDLEVRRQACVTLESLLRANAESLSRQLLKDDILPVLFIETKAHPELIEEVDYVAMKVIVDKGLPLRKQVYSSLFSLLQITPKRLDMQEYLKYVQNGLVDNQTEIQIATFEIFNHIAIHQTEALLELLDRLPDLLMNKVKDHLKAAKNPKEAQKDLDVLRAFVKSMVIFNKVPGVELCTKYTKFFKQVVATALLKDMLEEITKAGAASSS